MSVRSATAAPDPRRASKILNWYSPPATAKYANRSPSGDHAKPRSCAGSSCTHVRAPLRVSITISREVVGEMYVGSP